MAAAEMCIAAGTGCSVRAGSVPSERLAGDRLLFSESHSRYLLAADPRKSARVVEQLRSAGARAAEVGRFGGSKISFARGGSELASVSVDKARTEWSGGHGRR